MRITYKSGQYANRVGLAQSALFIALSNIRELAWSRYTRMSFVVNRPLEPDIINESFGRVCNLRDY